MLKKCFVIILLFFTTVVNAATSEMIADLQYLTQQIGGRPTGSPAMQTAMQWAQARFRMAGLHNAYLDDYIAPVNWLPSIEKAEIISGDKLHVAMMPFSANTPSDGLTAEVYAISEFNADEITKHQSQIKNRWLLVPTPELVSEVEFMAEEFNTAAIYHAAEKAGAAGIVWMSSHTERRLYRHNATFNGTMSKLPGAVLEREEALRLIQLLNQHQRVTLKLTLNGDIKFNAHNYNVVAEIKGESLPEEVIVVGAHLDSWDIGQGALDNGVNAMMVVDIARRIKQLEQQGQRPKRTIRFILFSGEELGLYGSWFYVKKNLNELDHIKAVIIHDIGSGRITGYSLGGREDMLDLVNHALHSSSQVNALTQTTDAFLGTDNFDYLLQGVPTLVANQDIKPYLPHYHSNTDTFENVDLKQLADNAEIATMLTWNLANTNERFPARLNQNDVLKLLHATGLDEQMQMTDIEFESRIKN